MMHVFLSGESQIGKSTIINQVIASRPHLRLGGFRTLSVPASIPGALAELYMLPAMDDGNHFDRLHLAGIRWGGGCFTAFPDTFSQTGCALLNEPGPFDLLLMDELGLMENQAVKFVSAVLRALDGPVAVLGVIKPFSSPLLDAVRAHTNVYVLNVTKENRGCMTDKVSDVLF